MYQLQELVDKYLQFIVDKHTKKLFLAHFKADPETLGIPDRIVQENPSLNNLIYNLSIEEGRYPDTFSAKLKGFSDKVSVTVLHSTLIFSNNLSHMRVMKNLNASLIFATVAKCLETYTSKWKPQAITFIPANPDLRPSYVLLSRIAEKKSNYIYINEDETNDRFASEAFCLLNKDLYNQILNVKRNN